MALRDLTDGLRAAAAEMQKLADASLRVQDINDSGGGGAGATPPGAPTVAPAPINLTFVSKITTAPTMSSGSGGGGGGTSRTLDEFSQFLQTKGIYDIKKANEETLRALKLEFEFILRRALDASGGMGFRKAGMG